MDSIGDFIYVIIALAWLLINGYRNYQKQKKNRPGQQSSAPRRQAPRRTEPEPKRPTFTIEDFLDPVPPPRPKPVEKKVVDLSGLQPDLQRPEFSPRKKYDFDKPTRKPRKKRKIRGLDEPFNMKKAVVYEIIMKRPDFY